MHGYLSDKECFLSEIGYFSSFCRVTALDFPGFGRAEPLSAPFGVGEYADWLKGALRELGLNRPKVIAHSFGARVAIKANCFSRMLLTGAAGVVEHRLSYHVRVGTYRFVKKFAPAYASRRFGSEEYRSLSPLMRESYKKIVNEDLRSAAARLDVPVLFVYGDRDETTPVRTGRKLQRAAGGGLVVLRGCGHFAFLDDPVRFRMIAEAFLFGKG